MKLNDAMLSDMEAVARIMKLAVGCADRNWDASTGDDPITITADEAFSLFMLVRFANSHPTYVPDGMEPIKLCMAQGAVAYIKTCLEGTCPDCGRRFDDDSMHDEGCPNHMNEYPMPDEVSDEPHPPKKECH